MGVERARQVRAQVIALRRARARTRQGARQSRETKLEGDKAGTADTTGDGAWAKAWNRTRLDRSAFRDGRAGLAGGRALVNSIETRRYHLTTSIKGSCPPPTPSLPVSSAGSTDPDTQTYSSTPQSSAKTEGVSRCAPFESSSHELASAAGEKANSKTLGAVTPYTGSGAGHNNPSSSQVGGIHMTARDTLVGSVRRLTRIVWKRATVPELEAKTLRGRIWAS
ncbi:hypothetical protein GGTG_06357 [Gaeumannomyces tritici R3-111a-1]|uniref:Uncharacterized protein n=1 Tax=Gaeumannomyces tritici (strain R3-111a-1) TaxID=644352 RepID=J3NYK5_GAET3|nr:hypothetical protein GGTG_06357 [Gaeumannomyces tritici R3-111a-1]EJT76438.1 hypothetical protein GGTG_06357 [Gaeumannomyces tritici R3-111a-1]